MESFSPLSIVFLSIGASQGIYASFIALGRRPVSNRNYLIAAYLINLVVLVLFSGLHKSGLIVAIPHLMLVHQFFNYSIGPLFYLFLRSILSERKLKTIDSIHFLLPLAVFINLLPFYLQPANVKAITIDHPPQIVPLTYHNYLLVSIVSIGFYLILTFKMILPVMRTSNSYKHATMTVAMLFLVTYVFVLIRYVTEYQTETLFIVLMGVTIIILYSSWAFVKPYESKREESIIKSKNVLVPEIYLTRMNLQIQNRFYLQPEIDIFKLADQADIPYYSIASVVQKMGFKNFNDLVNFYRVSYSAELLLQEDNDSKLLAIAYESGFNSKSSFYESFKKYKGHTPGEFRRLHFRDN